MVDRSGAQTPEVGSVGLSLVIELGSSRVVKREHHLVRLGYCNPRNEKSQINKKTTYLDALLTQ